MFMMMGSKCGRGGGEDNVNGWRGSGRKREEEEEEEDKGSEEVKRETGASGNSSAVGGGLTLSRRLGQRETESVFAFLVRRCVGVFLSDLCLCLCLSLCFCMCDFVCVIFCLCLCLSLCFCMCVRKNASAVCSVRLFCFRFKGCVRVCLGLRE